MMRWSRANLGKNCDPGGGCKKKTLARKPAIKELDFFVEESVHAV
jgi:hypothetical protein